MVGSPEECCAELKPCSEAFGVAHLIIHMDWARMPLSSSLASMRLISDGLLPALHRLSPGAWPGAAVVSSAVPPVLFACSMRALQSEDADDADESDSMGAPGGRARPRRNGVRL